MQWWFRIAERVERRAEQAALRARGQPDRGAGEDRPHDDRVVGGEAAALEQQRDDRAADCDERDGGRNDEEHDATKRTAQALLQVRGTCGIIARRARHLGQLRGGDRHAEQAHGQ